jgi:hypothetical protein
VATSWPGKWRLLNARANAPSCKKHSIKKFLSPFFMVLRCFFGGFLRNFSFFYVFLDLSADISS